MDMDSNHADFHVFMVLDLINSAYPQWQGDSINYSTRVPIFGDSIRVTFFTEWADSSHGRWQGENGHLPQPGNWD